MMAGNFQQMGNAGGNPMMMQQQPQQQVPGQQNMQLAILQALRNSTQGQQFTGWQATVNENHRMGMIAQIGTQLRLANPDGNQTKLYQNAVEFERHNFENATDRESYVKNIHAKLGQLTNARSMNNAHLQAAAQAQAQQQQAGMVNQGGGMGQPFQQGMQQLNMQHLQQQMQPSPMQGQQQPQQMPMSMGNNMMAQNMPANAQFQMNMQQQQQQAQMQAQQAGMPKQPQTFTPQEQQQITGMIKQLMERTTDVQKQQLRAKLQSEMDPAQLERYRTQHIDPLQQYFQRQAIFRCRQQRMQQAQQQAQQQGAQGMPMGLNRPQGAIPMQQQRSGNPNPMMPQQHPGQQHNIPGNAEFGFLDPQQQNQSTQDGNQLGMQLSLSQQGNTTPQNMAGLPVQAVTPNQQRLGQNPQMRAQQFNSQQQAVAQAQAQERLRKMAALQGQAGGMGPMPPNQSPAMNTLNAPLAGAPQQNPGGQGQPVPQAGPTQFGQPIDSRFAGMNQRPNVNGQPMAFPSNMTAEQRQRLQSMPPERLNEVMAKWNEQNAQRAAAMNLQNQQNGLAGGMPGGGQMLQNPGGAQLGHQGMANPMAQFMPNGQPMQRPPSQMSANLTSQQQALLRQQMQRQAQLQAGGPPQSQLPSDNVPVMPHIDQVEFPQQVYTIVPRQMIPQGLTKWGPLKQWLVQNGGVNGVPIETIMDRIAQLQRTHMASIIRNRQMQQANQPRIAGGPGQISVQQPGQPGITPQMAAQIAQAVPQITMADIQNARNHVSGRWATFNDDQIRQQLQNSHRTRAMAYLRNQAALAQQQQQQPQMQNQPFDQLPLGQMPQIPQVQNMAQNGVQRPVGPPQQQGQQMPPQGNKRPPPNQQGAPVAKQAPQPPMELKQTPQARAAKPAQPTSSPAQPPNNKKRASSDDVVEVPNPNQQVNRPQMQPGMGQKPSAFPPFTREQVAAMPPDKRRNYLEYMRHRQMQMQNMGPQATPAETELFAKIRDDEKAKRKPLEPLAMSPEETDRAVALLRSGHQRINQVYQIALKWFTIQKDEQRLRAFFRAHLNINDQFEDAATQKLKPALSMRLADIQAAMTVSTSLVQDVAAKFPEMMKQGPRPGLPGQAQPANAPGAPAPGQPQQTGSTPTPLNAANLLQQQQALSAAQKENSKQHIQRASTSNNKPPAAPTTAHAPNSQFPPQANAQGVKAQAAHHTSPAHQPQFVGNSPQGVPSLYGPAKIDQGQLRLPPTKKRKAEGGMTSSGNTPVQQPKQAPQQQSQPMMKQESQQGQQSSQIDAKLQQSQQPVGFICEVRDCEGVVPPFATKDELQQHRQIEHIRPTADPAQFLLSEMETYLGLDKKGTAAEAAALKKDASSTGKQPSPKSKAQTDMPPPQDAWAASGVNPQELMQIFKPFETGATGAISNVDAYRSIEPNDTPESTNSGKGSEPNSDITEGMSLDIDMQFSDEANWMPFGESDLAGFVIAETVEEGSGVGTVLRGNEGQELLEMDGQQGDANADGNEGWEGLVQWEDTDKPFEFDTGAFEMDDGSSWLN